MSPGVKEVPLRTPDSGDWELPGAHLLDTAITQSFVKHSDIFPFPKGAATMHRPGLGWAWVHYQLWLPALTSLGLHTISAITSYVTLDRLLSH